MPDRFNIPHFSKSGHIIRLINVSRLSLAFLLPTFGVAQAAGVYSPSGSGQVVVSTCSNRPCLKRDGVGPYRPKGLIIEGLSTAPSSWPLLSPAYRAMGQNLSASTLSGVQEFGADSVRFNISQVNLDPQSSYYDSKYAGRVVSFVQSARALGLTVLVEINDEQPPRSGRLGYPSEATNRAWQQLAPQFANDQGIMLGAYNEPSLTGTSSTDLARWQATYNSVVAAIRAAGANNVIVIDGPYFGQQLTPDLRSYLISDTANNLVYGVHPFPKGRMALPASWPSLFQQFCTSSNILCQVTAWNVYDLMVNGFEIRACPNQAPAPTQASVPATAKKLLSVAKQMNSGIYGWAYDYPNVIMDSSAPRTKTVSFTNFVDCQHTPGPWGAGDLLQRSFADPHW